MLGALGRRWRERRDAAALARRAIPDELWARTLADFPFLARVPGDDALLLRRLSSLFLDRKEFSGAAGFEIDDAVVTAIAAQACLPVLRLGLGAYDRFVGIVVHPDQVVAPRQVTDEHGIVHEYDEVLAGEAHDGGPVMLSWADVRLAGAHRPDGYNVVVHEFAHVIDMADGGDADGMPPLPDAAAQRAWLDTLVPEYDRFCERVVCGHETLLDPYAAEHPSEYFAVAAEAFFVVPEALKDEQPATYRLLSSYFRLDPAAWPV